MSTRTSMPELKDRMAASIVGQSHVVERLILYFSLESSAHSPGRRIAKQPRNALGQGSKPENIREVVIPVAQELPLQTNANVAAMIA